MPGDTAYGHHAAPVPVTLRPAPTALASFLLLTLGLLAEAVEFPLDLYGRAHFGKYLNSDSSIYYLEVSADFFCTVMKHRSLSMFIRYRDDLDVAGSLSSGVLFDPRRAHYYFALGAEYLRPSWALTGYFMHDCVHFIDIESDARPIFNRFKMALGSPDFNLARELRTDRKVLWQLTAGYYPGWQYHGWTVNTGADYRWDFNGDLRFTLIKRSLFASRLTASLGFARSDSVDYFQNKAGIESCLLSAGGNAAGLSLEYTIHSDDPVKNTDKLWLLSAFLQF